MISISWVGHSFVNVGVVIKLISVYTIGVSQFGYEIAENLMMLMCLCRLIDSDDFETDDALEARIMDEDFQCGQ